MALCFCVLAFRLSCPVYHLPCNARAEMDKTGPANPGLIGHSSHLFFIAQPTENIGTSTLKRLNFFQANSKIYNNHLYWQRKVK
jgi:hypothetical protein